ncbi:S-adenosylmethionine transporter [Tilletia horrida]|uniref:S-adenosylmethionine transporter n=1 Tax=Tilletia horrida TaxID=155126 RepID=A0AAN6G777_9BASI|nr:S-adenosylmethionine transporter [Tilletia horrida]KAK0523521.1 S-adenosylmethionine transporter [Tilletia horrida]
MAPDRAREAAAASAPTARPPPAFTTSLVSGAMSGLAVDIIFFPIDTIKTRLQSKQGFAASGAFKGIYSGLASVAVGSAPGAAIFFVTYESMKPALRRQAEAWGWRSEPAVHMLAASTAEAAACLVRVPTEVIKSRQQTAAYGTSTSTRQVLQLVLFEGGGLRALYRGYGSTIAREIPFTCIQFPLYERIKAAFAASNAREGRIPLAAPGASTEHSLPLWQAALSGSCAGAIAAAATTPLDVVKTRIMLERRRTGPSSATTAATAATSPTAAPTTSPSGVNTRLIPTLLHLIRNEGMKGCFAGIVPRTLWIGFGGAVFLGTFEAGVRLLEG